MSEKIVFYVGNFDKPEASAAGKRVYGNALILSRLGYRVVLIGKHRSMVEEVFPVSYGENIVFYSFTGIGMLKTQAFVDYIAQVTEKEGVPELIIRYGSPGLSLFDKQLFAFCKNRKIKLIADVVDWLGSGGGNIIFNCIKTVDTYLEKAIFNKKGDGVIAIGSYLSNYYRKKGCKTIIIPPVVKEYCKNEKTDDEVIRIVYAGVPFRLGRVVKNPQEVKDRLDLAVKAIGSVEKPEANFVFHIYGITSEQYLTAYPDHKEIVEKNSERIVFNGNQPMVEVQKAVQNADFTILLRDKNRATMAGFPTKVVESLSMGTPVITTDTSDLYKYIIQGKTGFLVDAFDEKKLTEQLTSILTVTGEQLSEMKQCCFEGRDFCVDKYTKALDDFIKEL